MAPTRERRSAHDPGVVLRALIVSIADGGDCVTDLGVLADQGVLFGAVASERTAHRVIKSVDAELLEATRDARAIARESAWGVGASASPSPSVSPSLSHRLLRTDPQLELGLR